jgi:hypothetical protein
VPRLFHVSETAGITRFEPRAGRPDPAAEIWAISEARLHNYLLPRDCPRVTYYATATTTPEDRARFLGDAASVVAIELAWAERARSTALSLYEFAGGDFTLRDEIAGYYTATAAQTPLEEVRIDSAMAALEERNVEVRLLESLWALREAVADSTLGFSIIRFRNAAPPPSGFVSRFPVP